MKKIVSVLIGGVIVIGGLLFQHETTKAPNVKTSESDQKLIDIKYDINKYPENYTTLNDNKTSLTDEDKALLKKKSKEHFWVDYNDLDKLGRGDEVTALITSQEMKKQRSKERPPFSSSTQIAGEFTHANFDKSNQTWHKTNQSERNNKEIESNGYHGWLYNKSHTLAWSLGGDMEEHNLSLGTRAQNVGTNKSKDGGGMGYPETQIRNTLDKKPSTKVYYQVKPVYQDNELVPRGSHVRAYSVNDNGKTLNLNVWVFNKQKGIDINYNDGTWEYK